jgi:hypothetical protein
MVNMMFFEDLYFVRFCGEINFQNSKKSPNKEATYRTAIHMKYSSKFLNNRIMQKNKFFSLI